MTKSEFNSRRQEIYQQLVKEAGKEARQRNDGRLSGCQQSAIQGVATRRFNKIEKAVYSA